MNCRWSNSTMLICALLATNLLACGAPEDSGGVDTEGDGNVTAIAAPLGTTTVTVAVVPSGKLLNLGPSQAIYSSTFCPLNLQVRSLSNGASLSLGEFPTCSSTTAASDSQVFVASGTNHKVYGWDLFQGFFEIAQATSPLRGRLLLDSQNLYFGDSTGLKRVSRSGGTVFIVKSGSDPHLLARDGSLLYFRLGSQLRRIHIGGTSEQVLINNVPALTDLTFDSTWLYWAIDASPDRLERMSKSGGSIAVLRTAAPNATIFDIVANNGNLYWTETANGSSILRRNSAGTVTTERTNMDDAEGLRAVSGFLYWNELVFGSPSTARLKKATLP